VIHERECLALLLETGDDILRIHPHLDDLQGHAALHWLLLIGDPDGSETTLTDLLSQLVRPDALTAFLRLQPRQQIFHLRTQRFGGRLHEHGRFVRSEQPLDPRTQREISSARRIEVGSTLATW